MYAELKASRAAARLGLRLLPEEMHGEVGDALIGYLRKKLEHYSKKLCDSEFYRFIHVLDYVG